VLTVTDVNEPPTFVSSHYVASVEENAAIGDQVLSGILAVDGDSVSNYYRNFLVVMLLFKLFLGYKCCYFIFHCESVGTSHRGWDPGECLWYTLYHFTLDWSA